MGRRGHELRDAWFQRFEEYRTKYPDLGDHLVRMQRRQLPEEWDKGLPTFEPDPKGVAGRAASGKVINALARSIPWLVGGSADLAPSTLTRLTFEGAGDLSQCHSSLKFGSAPVVAYADFFSFFSSALSAPRSNGSCA